MRFLKHILFIALLAIPAVAASAQTLHPQKTADGKWGLANADGIFILKAKYTDMEEARDGYFLVAEGGKEKDGILEGEKWGVVDAAGKQVLPAEYDEIGQFFNGLYKLSKKDKVGFADAQWKIVVPVKYSYSGLPSKQGLVWVNDGGKPLKDKPSQINGGKFGVFNTAGKEILPVKYSSLGYFTQTRGKYNQHKILNAKTDFERLTMEAGGQLTLQPKTIETTIDGLIPECMGLAFSTKAALLENGAAKTDGTILVGAGLYKRCAYPSDGIAVVTTKKAGVAFHDVKSGSMKTVDGTRSAFSFQNGKAVCVDARNQWTFVDTSMKKIGEAYSWISPLVEGYYIVKTKEGKMDLLKGDDLSPVVQGKDMIYPPAEGYMVYKEDGLCGLLDTDGKVAMEPTHPNICSFRHGAAIFGTSYAWGVLDTSLNVRIPAKYYTVYFPVEDNFNFLWVGTDSKYCAPLRWSDGSDPFGQRFTDFRYFVTEGGIEYAIVGNNGKYGALRADGHYAVPMIMNSKNQAQSAMVYALKANISNWEDIHTLRFNIYNDDKRNSYKLADKISENHWDY